MDMVKGAVRAAGRVLKAIGTEIAAAIRFGAVPASVEARGFNQNVNASAVVAGLGGLRNDEPDAEEVERD